MLRLSLVGTTGLVDIILIQTVNVVIGFVQEYRAEKTIDSLRSLSSPIASVLRDGKTTQVQSRDIVPGDIIIVTAGDVVPADARIIEGMNLQVDEALLTGESLPVIKTVATLRSPHKIKDQEFKGQDIGVGDRSNMLWSSATITQGRAKAVVVDTGMTTQIGGIAVALGDDPHDLSQQTSAKSPRWKRFTIKCLKFLGLRDKTPLQVKLNKFAYLLLGLAVLCALIVFSVAEFHITNEVALYAIALGIGVLPESLIAVLTIIFSIGAKRMATQNVVVRKLDALEALGGITDICTDKTGTLTQGKMVVRSLWSVSSRSFYKVYSGTVSSSHQVSRLNEGRDEPIDLTDLPLEVDQITRAASLCNAAELERDKTGEWVSRGDPTEIALQHFAQKLNLSRSLLIKSSMTTLTSGEVVGDTFIAEAEAETAAFRLCYTLHTEYPFDSQVKRMTMVYVDHRDDDSLICFQKGAVERVLMTCSSVACEKGMATTLTEDDQQEIITRMESLASQGLRVLAFAVRKLEPDATLLNREEAEQDFTFIGLIGIYDPPRPESRDAVNACKTAGITPRMLTGDHVTTARAIAMEVGILTADAPPSAVMTATEFDSLTGDQVDSLVDLPLVIARCSPNTKVSMIKAGKRRNLAMAMTGDGINDAPSLKQALVGVSMGKNGTDVAKNASDIILTDDNFDSIRSAIAEGRTIFDNTQRFIVSLLVANAGEVILLLVGLAFKDDQGESVFPLSPLQILWANMVTASLPAVGLGLEPMAADVMQRPPHDLKAGIFNPTVILDTFAYGTVMGVTCLVAFVTVVFASPTNSKLGLDCNSNSLEICDTVFRARSTVFATLVLQNLILAWELKSLDRSLFNLTPGRPFWKDIWNNQLLMWSVLFGAATIQVCIYVPGLNDVVFQQTGISWEWGIVLGCTAVFILAIEGWKALGRRGNLWARKRPTAVFKVLH